jgi:hypothetical protein
MHAIDGYLASNIDATIAAFKLEGGLYGVDAMATWGSSSVKLQRVAVLTTAVAVPAWLTPQ